MAQSLDYASPDLNQRLQPGWGFYLIRIFQLVGALGAIILLVWSIIRLCNSRREAALFVLSVTGPATVAELLVASIPAWFYIGFNFDILSEKQFRLLKWLAAAPPSLTALITLLIFLLAIG